jgi:hypothetical protein
LLGRPKQKKNKIRKNILTFPAAQKFGKMSHQERGHLARNHDKQTQAEKE